MAIDDSKTAASESRLRNEPVQARSAARLSALLDAAALLVDEVGYERLTTAMVAERANASIGTVYRYFPDRLAVLDGLAGRALTRFMERIEREFDARGPATIAERFDVIVDTLIYFYRNEPGYRVLRFGDVIDANFADGMDRTDHALARALGETLRRRDASLDAEDLAFRLQVALAICETLVHRAFASRDECDTRFVDEAKAIAGRYLAGHSMQGE